MNSRLDRAEVPSYAVELILYHEMLHVKQSLARSCMWTPGALRRISRGRKTVVNITSARENSSITFDRLYFSGSSWRRRPRGVLTVHVFIAKPPAGRRRHKTVLED